jgi:hypothetical protein
MGRRATADEIEYFSNSAVGVAVVGDDLFCTAINTSLVAMHSLSSNVHLGKPLREVLGRSRLSIGRCSQAGLGQWAASCQCPHRRG